MSLSVNLSEAELRSIGIFTWPMCLIQLWDYFFLPQWDIVITVMINQFIKSILFLLIQDTWNVERLNQLCVTCIEQMYGILTTTESNRN